LCALSDSAWQSHSICNHEPLVGNQVWHISGMLVVFSYRSLHSQGFFLIPVKSLPSRLPMERPKSPWKSSRRSPVSGCHLPDLKQRMHKNRAAALSRSVTTDTHTKEIGTAINRCRMLLGHSLKLNQTVLLCGKLSSNTSTCCHVWNVVCVIQWLVQPLLNHW